MHKKLVSLNLTAEYKQPLSAPGSYSTKRDLQKLCSEIDTLLLSGYNCPSLTNTFLDKNSRDMLTSLLDRIHTIKDPSERKAKLRYYYYCRLKALEKIDDLAKDGGDADALFLSLPLDMKLEFLLTKRNRKTTPLPPKASKATITWHRQLTGALADSDIPEASKKLLAAILLMNNDDVLRNTAKDWITKNLSEGIAKPILSRVNDLSKLKSNKRYKSTDTDKMLAGGIFPEYVEAFGFSAREIKLLVRPFGKYKMSLFFELLLRNPSFPESDCRELAVVRTGTHQDILHGIRLIQEDNPQLTSSEQRQLGIHSNRNWQKKVSLLPVIEKKAIELIKAHPAAKAQGKRTVSASECKQLMLHHPDNYEKVILAMLDAHNKNPHLPWHFCKRLVMQHGMNWEHKLRELPAVRNKARELFRTYGLDETKTLSDEESRKLLLSCSDTEARLHEIARFHLSHPELPWYAAKELTIRGSDSYSRTMRITDSIKKEAPAIVGRDRDGIPRTLLPGDYYILALRAPESWKKNLQFAVQLHDSHPYLTWALCKTLAIKCRNTPETPEKILKAVALHRQHSWMPLPRCLFLVLQHPNSYKQVVSRYLLLKNDLFWSRHFSDNALFELARRTSGIAKYTKQVKANYRDYDYLVRTHVLSDDKTWGEREMGRLVFATSILALEVSISDIQGQLATRNPFECLSLFTQLAVQQYGTLAGRLINCFHDMENITEQATGHADGTVTIVESDTETKIIRMEERRKWQELTMQVVTPEEYEALEAFMFGEQWHVAELENAIRKLKNVQPVHDAIREAAAN